MRNSYQNPTLVVKNGIFLFLRQLLVLFLAFFTTRLTLHILGDEKYGIYNIVGGVIAVFAIISMPIRDSLQRFLNVEFVKGIINPNKVFCTSVRLVWFMIIMITLLYETVGLYLINFIIQYPEEENFTVNVIFQITVLSNILGFANLPYLSLLYAKENMRVLAVCEIILSIFRLVLLYIIPYINVNLLIPYACIFLLTNILQYAFYRLYCERHYNECIINGNFDVPLRKNMLKFSGWSFVEAVAGIALTYIPNLFINVFGGVLYNTAFGISKQLQNAVINCVSNVLKASDPQITSSTTIANDHYRNQLVMTTLKISFLGVAFVFISFCFDGFFMLDIWLDKVPNYALEFCGIMLLSIVFSSISLPLRTVILATGRIKGYFLTYGIVSGVSIIIMYALLKMGAPIITAMYLILFSSCVMFMVAILIVVHVSSIRLSLIIKSIARSILSLLIAALTYYIVHHFISDEVARLVFSILLSFCVLALTSYYIAFNSSEKEKINQIIYKLKSLIYRK